MAAVAPIVMGISTAFQVVGAIKQGNAAEDAANANAEISEKNAAIARQVALGEERTFRQKTRQIFGEQQAAFAASGGGFSGSANSVLHESATAMEMDALKIRYGGELKAAGFENDAKLYRQRGSSYGGSTALSAAGYLAGGIGNVVDKADKYW